MRPSSAASTATIVAQHARRVAAPPPMKCRIVAIDGAGGAGKDTRTLAEWHAVPVAAFLVLEGVSCSRGAFAPYLAFRGWVNTPREERLRRGLERDGQDAIGLWREWMAREDEYIDAERPQERRPRGLRTDRHDLTDPVDHPLRESEVESLLTRLAS